MLSLFIGFFREEVKNFRTLQKPLCSFGHCFYTLHVTTGTVQGLLQVTKIMYLLTELGRAGLENIWPEVMAYGPSVARSVRHDRVPNIFPSGPT